MQKIKHLLVSSLCFLATICLVVGTVCAWFFSGIRLDTLNVSGSSPSSYFASGDGTKDTPYSITKPIHLYNLAWLQYMGTFNEPTNNTLSQTYFTVDADLDMQGFVLPPIGTLDEPFIGVFDGNNHVIKNLTVSNTLSSITNKPTIDFSALNNKDLAEIVGFFGVVGDYDGSLKNNYKFDTSTVSITNLYLDYIKINSQSSYSLIGLVAGYVNGTVKNVGVYHSAINTKQNTLALKTKNGFSLGATNKTYLSRSALIGEYDTGVTWKGLPVTSEGSGNTGNTGGDSNTGGGQNSGFGGSLDMYTLNKRLSYIFGATLSDSATKGVYAATSTVVSNNNTKGKFNAYLAMDPRYYMYVAENSVSMPTYSTGLKKMSVMSGTYLPLNVDTDTMFDTETQPVTITFGSYTDPLYSSNYYTSASNTSERILSTNTGYIVASPDDTTVEAIVGRIDGLSNSVTLASNSTTSYSSFKLFTYNSSKAKVEISDTNNYVRYSTVRQQLINSIKLFDCNGVNYLAYNGFHFTAAVNTKTFLTASQVSLSGTTYTNYEFLASSINFHLTQAGYITAVICNNQSSTTGGTSKMFTLYRITREDGEPEKISTVTEITSATDSNGNVVYDSSYYPDGLDSYSMYYVEIPVAAGDYAIGTSANSKGAYFLYLDVGANASGDSDNSGGSGDSGNTDTDKTEETLIIKDVYFVAAIPVNSTLENVKFINIEINITDLATAAACIYFLRQTGDSSDVLNYFVKVGDEITTSATGVFGTKETKEDNTISFATSTSPIWDSDKTTQSSSSGTSGS